jgi:mRNA interferase MazF
MGSHSVIKYKIVLIPFPFDDLTASKVRPAVCMTEPIGPHRHVVLAFITSQRSSPPLPTDISLDAHHPDFPMTGLRQSSILQTHRLMTATTSLIQRELGQLAPGYQQILDGQIRLLFGL